MWVSMAACTWLVGRLDTQLGSWLCQTRLWPRTTSLCALAKATTVSPPEKLNVPLDGSVVSHFIELPGVMPPHSLPRIDVYAESDSSGLSVAEPKNSLPLALASWSRVVAARAGPLVSATTLTTPAKAASRIATRRVAVRRRAVGTGGGDVGMVRCSLEVGTDKVTPLSPEHLKHIGIAPKVPVPDRGRRLQVFARSRV